MKAEFEAYSDAYGKEAGVGIKDRCATVVQDADHALMGGEGWLCCMVLCGATDAAPCLCTPCVHVLQVKDRAPGGECREGRRAVWAANFEVRNNSRTP